MKILLDHNIPVYLAKLFQGYDVATAYRQGWAALKNGKLIAAAEDAGFELLVTLDKNIQYQQRLKGRILCVAILDPESQTEEDFVATGLKLLRRLDEVQPGTLMTVNRDDP